MSENNVKTPIKSVVSKSPFDTYYDMTLFSFRCPRFIISIVWQNYMCQFRSLEKTVNLPTPDLLQVALLDFCSRGNIEKLFALPCVSFSARGTNYLDGVISVDPSTSFYATQFIRSYAVFYNNFNQKNYLVK